MTASALAAARAVILRLAHEAAAAPGPAATTTTPRSSSSARCPMEVAIAAFRAAVGGHLSLDGFCAAVLPPRTAPPASPATETGASAASARSSAAATDLTDPSARAAAMVADLCIPPAPAGAPERWNLGTLPAPAPRAPKGLLVRTFLPTGCRLFSSSALVAATPTTPLPHAAPPSPSRWKLCVPPPPAEAPKGPSMKTSLPAGSRLFSSSAVGTEIPTPPLPPASVTVSYLIDLLNGLVLSPNEELRFRKAFNEKFDTLKVADIICYLEKESFTIEEYCLLLKMVYSKLGDNRDLVELLLQEAIPLSASHDEVTKFPILVRMETKVDILTKKFDEGHAEVLKCVKVSNKGEWGSVQVFGRKLDLTKLEYLKKLIDILTGY